MDRRAFVTSGLGLGAATLLAGCLGDDDTDDEMIGNNHREIDISEHFAREREVLSHGVLELDIRNTSDQPRSLRVTLQMRDIDGNDVGSEYTEEDGPIEPEEVASVRFELDEEHLELVGYKLVIEDPEES